MRIVAVSVVITLIVFALPGDTSACTCLQTQGPGRPGIAEVPRYDAIFLGRVVAMTIADVDDVVAGERVVRHFVDVTINVAKSWKGPRSPKSVVRTKSRGGPCGYPFKLGESYLIYARGTSEPYYAHLCDPTKPIDASVEDTATLDTMFPDSYAAPSN